MIGVMLPNVFSVSEKIFGDDYYVDEYFGFAIKIPNGGYVDTEAILLDNSRALTSIQFGGDDEWYSVFVIHFFQEDPDLIYYDDLLYYFSESPQMVGGEYTQQIKITNEEIEQQGDTYKVIYEFTTKDYYPNNYFNSDYAGKTFTQGHKIVFFVYPNGDYYELIMSSKIQNYSKDVKIFDSSVDTFYVGNVKKISSNIGNSNPTIFEPVIESNPIQEITNNQCGEGTILKNNVCVLEITCGEGTIMKNGQCVVVNSSSGGGCLIATATYGSEMSPQVQQLRELRDNQLLQTESGKQFMGTFNDIYYSFSPTIADMEREHPMFKEAVKLAITPMISTLSLMENAETESEVLSIGISVIALNLGMYLGVPAIVIVGIRKKF